MNGNLKLQSSHTGADGRRYETWSDTQTGEIYTRGADGKLTRAKGPESTMTIIASSHRGGSSEKILRNQAGQLFHQVGREPPEQITESLAHSIRQGWTHCPPHRV